MKINTSLLVAILLSLLPITSFAQVKVIPLYSGEIPNSKKAPAAYQEILDTNGLFTKISIPTLTVYTPKKGTANGTAVIILPSGGYRVLVDEGVAFAKAFNSKGITAFVLKYRLPSDEIMIDKSIGPLQDAQMAIKLVRMNAKAFNIDPVKIGFVGVSAGGHLASTEATHLNTILINNQEKINLRPDFLILVYPVISFTQAKVTATIDKLLGANPSEDLLSFFSNEKHVTANTPPTFLLHAGDDERVSVQHSLIFYEALQHAKVKSEFHILQNGGHGFALEHETRADKWFSWCSEWLNENGFGIQTKKKK
ncbi:alpha/beta hydrolase [Pedobacter frigiditerrae]|uniref:alpha/beta hydrolase n=1 Tax=Pedobacter frigiditerrae TaxID=2530452 RepID=UPI00292E1DE8|nr:alpha/beta hydrolase [Pedobacter frigiditerrae]